MPSTLDLADHIANLSVIDTHSHLAGDFAWEGPDAPDILGELFGWYASSDLIVAGAAVEAVDRLLDRSDPDLAARFAGVAEAWKRMQFTGYGEAVRIAARDLFAIEDLSAGAILEGQKRLEALQTRGGTVALLRDRAKLEHIQTDLGMDLIDLPPTSADFFLRDLSIRRFAVGELTGSELIAATGVEIRNLATLGEAISALFSRCAPASIAVKSQHAYVRTLAWEQRTDADAERALEVVLAGGPGSDDPQSDARRCVGDWALARCVEQAIAHDLPIKFHTGYLAGANTFMPIDRLRAAHLAPLLMAYPRARFILMHTAYPYGDELIALAKHFSNVTVDLCWAWALNPLACRDFVRRFLHAVPHNRLLAFGDDTNSPSMAYAYAVQMRRWLSRTLAEEVEDGYMTPSQAIDVATHVLRENQLEHFDIAGTRAAVRDAIAMADTDDTRSPWPYRFDAAAEA